jgi:hypothetical protein
MRHRRRQAGVEISGQGRIAAGFRRRYDADDVTPGEYALPSVRPDATMIRTDAIVIVDDIKEDSDADCVDYGDPTR